MKNVFDKPTLRWSKTVYTIHKAKPRSYELYNPDIQSVLQAVVKANELQKIDKVDVAEHKIADAHIAKRHIAERNIEKLHKQLSNDTKNILPSESKRTRRSTKSTKFADFL